MNSSNKRPVGFGINDLDGTIADDGWLFHDTDDGEPTDCPVCCQPLDLDVKWGTRKFRTCGIQI